MKLRHVMTAALGALVLSCQGPAAVLAHSAPGPRPDGWKAHHDESPKDTTVPGPDAERVTNRPS